MGLLHFVAPPGVAGAYWPAGQGWQLLTEVCPYCVPNVPPGQGKQVTPEAYSPGTQLGKGLGVGLARGAITAAAGYG